MARPKKYSVHLSDDNVRRLRSLIRKRDTSDTVSNRCRILMDLDEDHPPALTHKACANKRGVTMTTVANTVALYCKDGLDAVLKLKRNVNSDNARRKVDGRTEARIIEIACGPVPDGHSRWTIRLLEDQVKVELVEPISHEAIRRALKKPASSSPQRLLVPPEAERLRVCRLHEGYP